MVDDEFEIFNTAKEQVYRIPLNSPNSGNYERRFLDCTNDVLLKSIDDLFGAQRDLSRDFSRKYQEVELAEIRPCKLKLGDLRSIVQLATYRSR